jgi:hypothetical protein
MTAAEPDPYETLLRPIPERRVVLTFDDACRTGPWSLMATFHEREQDSDEWQHSKV